MFRKVVFVAAFMLGLIFAAGYSIENSQELKPTQERKSPIFANLTAFSNGEHPSGCHDHKECTLFYTFGEREYDDRLIHTVKKKISYPTVLDHAKQHVKYAPSHENEHTVEVVTYVYIEVNQTSSEGSCFINSGGIYEENIDIVIEAEDTKIIDIIAKFYVK